MGATIDCMTADKQRKRRQKGAVMLTVCCYNDYCGYYQTKFFHFICLSAGSMLRARQV
ncbi:hypothetical protein CSB69_3798 [Morganella morganii]|nr:hypothetical protein CSB69_3798 [Morganella morganii]EMP51849.1 hypothetical protein C790_00748 [Morganella morganii SC01]